MFRLWADEGIGPYRLYRRFLKGGQSRPPLQEIQNPAEGIFL